MDEIWLIDGAKRRVEISGEGGWMIFERGAALTSRMLPGFELALETLFG